MQPAPTALRYRSLDSVRGLAALIVVVFHTMVELHLNIGLAIDDVPFLNAVWAGPQSVVLFFVLSGFVLSIPYHAGRAGPPLQFVIKRFVRLYPVYALAVIASAAGAAILNPRYPRTGLWSPGRALAAYLPMLGPYRGGLIDTPIWSIVHEMRISLLFPLLMFVLVRRWGHLPAALLLSIGAAVLATATGNDLFATLQYIPLFAAGAWLALNRERLGRLYLRRRLLARAALVAGAVAVFGMPWFDYGLRDGVWQLPVLASCIVLFVAALAEPALQPVLGWRPLTALGAISYSLYLVHGLVLLAALPLLLNALPAYAAVLLCWAILLPLSALVYRFVEVPSIDLSRRLAAVKLPGWVPFGGAQPALVEAA